MLELARADFSLYGFWIVGEVIASPLLRAGKNFVGFVDILEGFGGSSWPVWMEANCGLMVGDADFLVDVGCV